MESNHPPRRSQYEEYWERTKRVEHNAGSRIIAFGMLLAGGALYFLPSKPLYRAIAFAPVFLLFFLLGEFAANGAASRMWSQAESILTSVRHDLDEWRARASLEGEAWKGSSRAHQVYKELGWFRAWCDALVLRHATGTTAAKIKREAFNALLAVSCLFLVANTIDFLVRLTRYVALHHVVTLSVAIPLGLLALTAVVEGIFGAMAIHNYRAGLRILTRLSALDGIGRLKEQEVVEELHDLADAMDELTKVASPHKPKGSLS